MRLPKFIRHAIAFFCGYFWLPCPICGKMFGGFECGETLYQSWSRGSMVCKKAECGEEAGRRNDVLFARLRSMERDA